MIRLALIGGDLQIARDYAQAARRIRLADFTALSQTNAAIRHEAAAALRVATTSPSAETLLDEHASEFDAVLIQGSDCSRIELACRAATAGKHVLLSAPLADSVDEAQQVVTACRQASVRLMVGHTARFRPSLASVRQALDSGKLGDPSLLRIHAWDSDGGSDAVHLRGTEQGFPSWPRLTEQLDLALWFMEGWPTVVFSTGSAEAEPGSSRWPRHLQVHLGFGDSGMALITVATTAMSPGHQYDMVSLIGSTGAAYADDFDQTQLLFHPDRTTALRTGEGIFPLTEQLREFVTAIGENRDTVVCGEAGVAALRLTGVVWETFNGGHPIHLAGEFHESGH